MTNAIKKKKFLSAEEIAAEVENRNQVFAAASPEQKRMLIAKDVIEQVKAKRFRAVEGTWVAPTHKNGRELFVEDRFDADDSMRELFIGKKIPACECCALGAMFMSCTLYNDDTTVGTFDEEVGWKFDELVMSGELSNGLSDIFDAAQLKLIETAFEGGDGAFIADKNDPVSQKAADWLHQLSDAEKRLVAIMQNIIENNGTFVP